MQGVILFSYFEKTMRSQLVMMQRSAQGEQQKMDILSNELVRRLSNVSEGVDFEESLQIVNHYTKQLKNSGYEWKQSREIVICGLRGYLNKCDRREKAGETFYRKAGKTLNKRVRKKLLEKTSCSRAERKRQRNSRRVKDSIWMERKRKL